MQSYNKARPVFGLLTTLSYQLGPREDYVKSYNESPNHLHRSHRVGWLRASVMGANDGIVSTASLLIGVAAASVSHHHVMIAGASGLVAGAMSMAAGEYVSVCSQQDTELADIELEKHHLEHHKEFELRELTDIYIERGLSPDLASQVADELMQHDALGAHLRDELGINERTIAKPITAAVTSALSFTLGASLPLGISYFSAVDKIIYSVSISCLFSLILLGAIAAKTGGASQLRGAFRVVFWGALAMLFTAIIGNLFAGLVS